jgi:hypothetical protein
MALMRLMSDNAQELWPPSVSGEGEYVRSLDILSRFDSE